MRPIAIPLVLATALAGAPAAGQSVDPYPGYDTAPPASGYGNAPPPPGGVGYHDDERYGSEDSYGSADARSGNDPRGGWQGRGGPPPGVGRQNPRTRAYAGRVAQWRARADACEAGDLRACRGPD